MEVTLPSGGTAQFRDVMLRGDIREARRGMVFITGADGSRRTDGAFLDDLTGRVISRMLVAWPQELGPLPGNAAGGELQQAILDRLSEADYSALEAAVQPFVQRVIRPPNSGWSFVHQGTGVTVTVNDEGEALRLGASPDFAQVEGGPKAGQRSIGTSGSASPSEGDGGPDGQSPTSGSTP